MSNPTPKNTKLYVSVKKDAKQKFENYPSSWIVRKYKKRAGTYTGKDTGTTKWYTEKWVQLESYLKTGKTVQTTNTCRPLKRVNSRTPITISELVRIATFSHWIGKNKKIRAVG